MQHRETERERERESRIKRNTPKCRWSVKTIKLNIPKKCRCGWPFPLHSVSPYLWKLWLVGSWGGTFYIHLVKTSFNQRAHFTLESLARQAHFTLNLWPNRPILHLNLWPNRPILHWISCQTGPFYIESLAKQTHFTLNLWPKRPILSCGGGEEEDEEEEEGNQQPNLNPILRQALFTKLCAYIVWISWGDRMAYQLWFKGTVLQLFGYSSAHDYLKKGLPKPQFWTWGGL